jgi:Resolvase, N terminal domain
MTREAIFYLPTGSDAGALGDPERAAMDGVEVIERVDDGGGPARSGLARALELIGAGRAAVLVVAQLRDAASSLGELVRLLAWLDEAGATLVALDVGFDSSEVDARLAVALLREVERWDREPHLGRRPRGRPGLSSIDPELAERLSLLRGRGLSLQAIAAVMNADGVPTPRGGVQWRPSSVQAALGYRRPRPPVPGAPPVPPPRPPGAGPRHAPPHGPGAPPPPGSGAPPPPGPGAPPAPDAGVRAPGRGTDSRRGPPKPPPAPRSKRER